jgi:O-methyltransferase
MNFIVSIVNSTFLRLIGFFKTGTKAKFVLNNDDSTEATILEDLTPTQIEANCVLSVSSVVELFRSQHLTVSWGDRLLTLDKTAGFMNDPAFEAAFASVKGSHIYDQYNGPDTVAWRLNTLCWAARCALQVGGDFVECGVFKGDFAWVVMQTLGSESIPKFFLYDSFEGFSPDYSEASDYPLNPGFLAYANTHYQVDGMFEYVRDRFAPFPNVEVVKGFLPDSLALACPERIGFLHVDLNSPRAEVAVLEQLFDKVVPGGVIVFDDYGWKLFEKQKEAEDVFMKARGYEILELPTGQGLVVKR